MNQGSIVGAAWVPGLPHILNPEKSAAWKNVSLAYSRLRENLEEAKPDTLVIYSTQWMSVLGMSFQTAPHLKGIHVDDNWYDWTDLPFDFKSDVSLSERFATSVSHIGYPTKTINIESFPIDTGTIVTLKGLDPQRKYPVSVVSSWVYADGDKSQAIGKAMQKAIFDSGKRVFVIASSLLSARYFTREISPELDKISAESDDSVNRKMLSLWESGDFDSARKFSAEFCKNTVPDMQFNAFHWLSGVLDRIPVRGNILHYGPIWGTGAAVVGFRSAS